MIFSNYKEVIFVDVDATLTYQSPDRSLSDFIKMMHPLNALPGVVDKVTKWYNSKVKIIITTARPEILRNFTEKELERLKIPYHLLLMDCGNCPRTVINNFQFNSTVPMARSINVDANSGLEKVDLEG